METSLPNVVLVVVVEHTGEESSGVKDDLFVDSNRNVGTKLMEEKLEGSSSKDVHFTVPSSSYKIKYYMLQVSRKKRATHDLSSKVACVNGSKCC